MKESYLFFNQSYRWKRSSLRGQRFLRERDFLHTQKPKGLLFVGPSGVGKTVCAKAIAGSANVPFIYVSGTSFFNLEVKNSTQFLKNLFHQIKKMTPCVLLIDKIEWIGKSRKELISPLFQRKFRVNQVPFGTKGSFGKKKQGPMASTGHYESGTAFQSITRNQRFLRKETAFHKKRKSKWVNRKIKSKLTHNSKRLRALPQKNLPLLTEFLVIMDAFASEQLVIIGTTNSLTQLDRAFVRPGRFEKIVPFNLPTRVIRFKILHNYLNEFNNLSFELEKESSLSRTPHQDKLVENLTINEWTILLNKTKNCSGADLYSIVQESFLFLMQQKEKNHNFQSLHSGFKKVLKLKHLER